MRISDWSSDVCSSDLDHRAAPVRHGGAATWRRGRGLERLARAAWAAPDPGQAVGTAAGAGLPVPALDRLRQPRDRLRRELLIDARPAASAAGHTNARLPDIGRANV